MVRRSILPGSPVAAASRGQMAEVLRRVFFTEREFDACVRTCFPEIFMQFQGVPTLLDKLELLVRLAEPAEILAYLHAYFREVPGVLAAIDFHDFLTRVTPNLAQTDKAADSGETEEARSIPAGSDKRAHSVLAEFRVSSEVPRPWQERSRPEPSMATAAEAPTMPREDPIDKAFRKLDVGWFGIDAPRRMQVEQAITISAVAIRDRMQRAMVEQSLRLDGRRSEEVPLGRLLRVELIPDQALDFTVVQLSEAEQPVLRNEVTQWEWSVTPHRSGPRQMLRVRATNLVDVAGQRLRKSHPVRTLEVEVFVQSVERMLAQPAEIETPLLRELLMRLLPSDSDFEAFTLDYFPTVFRRFSLGMERQQKFSLLLSYAAGSDILRRLSDAHEEEVQRSLLLIRSGHARS